MQFWEYTNLNLAAIDVLFNINTKLKAMHDLGATHSRKLFTHFYDIYVTTTMIFYFNQHKEACLCHEIFATILG